MINNLFRLILICSFVIVAGADVRAATEAVPDSADAVAARAFDVMAGPAWEKARYIAFTFNVFRDGKIAASFPQRLDRYTGDYRVSGRDRDGKEFVVVMNINTKQGRAWLDGAAVNDPADLLATGYRRFINDTYWLLMPLKLRDPGVKLERAGEVNECGRVVDVLKLSFGEGIGLTSGDQYWVGIDRDSGLAVTWEMQLQNAKPEQPRGKWALKRYERKGGLLLSTLKQQAAGTSNISLDDVTVSSVVPADAFR